MEEQRSCPKALDEFSNIMWGLCLAGSLAVLSEVAKITCPREFVVRAVCAVCVAFTVLRNYYVNRTVLARYGHVYGQTAHRYSEKFNWLLTTYILTFFGLVVFQHRPLLASLSLVPVSLVGVAVLLYELGVQTKALDSAAEDHLEEECIEAIRMLRGLYSFWLRFDLALGIAGLLLACLVWQGWLGAPWAEILAFSAVLVLFNVIDLVRNCGFHFARVERVEPC